MYLTIVTMTFQERIDIPCIGQLNTREILSNCGFYYTCDRQGDISIPEFNEKTIVDVGCGVSDFLQTISQVSKPKKLYGIDIIFENEQAFRQATIDLDMHLQKYAKIASGMIRNPTLQNEVMYTQSKLRERMTCLSEFGYNKDIDYLSDILSIPTGSVDIIFISFLMYRVQEHDTLLELLFPYLSDTGKIIVTDFPLDRFPVIDLYHPVKLGETSGDRVTGNSFISFEIIK